MHDVVVALRANRRRGTASTKTKADVNASAAPNPGGRRAPAEHAPATNRHRFGSGGGVAFGPHPRDYSKKVPKKVKTLAFRKALSERVLAGDVLLVEDFTVKEAKTKQFLTLVAGQAGKCSEDFDCWNGL